MKNKWIGAVLVVLIFAVGIFSGVVLMQNDTPEDQSSSENPISASESVDSEESSSVSEQSKSESEELDSSSVSEEETGSEETKPAADSKTNVPEPIAPSADTEKEKVFHGTIVDATMNSVLVKEDETGREVDFSRETADVSGRIVIDAKVDVYYTGEIEGTDASNVFVTRIESKA